MYTGDFLEVDISGGTKSTTVENDLGRKTFLFRRYNITISYTASPVTSYISITWTFFRFVNQVMFLLVPGLLHMPFLSAGMLLLLLIVLDNV